MTLSIVLIKNHELWADEMRAWNVSAGSSGIFELIDNLRAREGHPYFWYFLLYFISHFITGKPEAMQIFHLIISCLRRPGVYHTYHNKHFFLNIASWLLFLLPDVPQK